MALVIGTDAYIDLVFADDYWITDRNDATWQAASVAERERAILEATQYLDASYDWIGTHPGDQAQVLGWPRLNAVDHEGRAIEGIPLKVQEATAELALEALAGRLLASDERGGDIKREKVGGLEVEYLERAPGTRGYPFVDRLLRGLVRRGPNATSLTRA